MPAPGRPDATGPGIDGDRLRSILESAADHAIVAAAPNGRITGWWGSASRLLGWEEAEALRDGGYRVLETPDGAAALRLLDGGGRVDVLVADMGLPGGLDGRQVADAARGRRPGLRVLFMTGHVEAAGPGAKIGKPFPLDVLAERIGAAQSGRD